MIVASFIPWTPLIDALELKYRFLFSGLAQNKTEDDNLAQFIFLRQCLFQKHRSLNLSQATKNQAILQLQILNEKTKKPTKRKEQANEEESFSEGCFLLGQILNGGTKLEESFFQIILNQFKDTTNFQAFLFLINFALQLPSRYRTFALILFYNFRERTIDKKSTLEKCRYQILYQEIIKRFAQPIRQQQINFISFSQKVQKLKELTQRCLNEEIKLILALTDAKNRSELFADTHLLKISEIKQKIKKTFGECFKQKLYLSHSQFKYVYLMYQVAIQKRYIALKKDIKSTFLSAEAKIANFSYLPRYLAVLKGSGNGEIMNSNESFNNYFNLSAKSQNRSTISQLFPTDKQKRKHRALMTDYSKEVSQRTGDHSKYQCILAVQLQVDKQNIKVLQSFKIETRIYWESQNGFNYVCQIKKFQESSQEVVTVLKKQRDLAQKKGLELIPKNIRTITQLEEQFQVCDVEGLLSQTSKNHNQQTDITKKQVVKPENTSFHVDSCFSDKTKLIQQKLIEKMSKNKEGKIKLRGLPKLFLIVLMGISIGVAYITLSNAIESLKFQLTFEMKSFRDASLARNRIMVSKLILSLVKGTQFFPDSVCGFSQIYNLTSYFTEYMLKDLNNGFEDYTNLIFLPDKESTLLPDLYSNFVSPLPHLVNLRSNVSFQKYVSLLKAEYFHWVSQVINGVKPIIDLDYYSQTFPNQLLSYSVFSNTSISPLQNNSTNPFYSDMLGVANELNVIFLIFTTLVGIATVFFVIRDTVPLISIIQNFENIDTKILSSRIKQLKYALNLLIKTKTSKILSLEFDQHFFTLYQDNCPVQTKILEEFTRQAKQCYKDNQEQVLSEQQREDTALLKTRQIQNSLKFPKSKIFQAFAYNRCYFFMLLTIIGIVSSITLKVFDGLNLKVQALQDYQKVDEKLTLLHEKYINAVAFNWLNALSIVTPFNLTSSLKKLYSDSLQTFKSINIQQLFYRRYPKNLANEILYGDGCKYFFTNQLCINFRFGAFTYGFSVLQPLTVRQQIQNLQISASDHTFHIPNACDKTFILFEGLASANRKIPLAGLQVVLGSIDTELKVYIIITEFLIILLLFLTILCHSQRTTKYQKLREQVLSFDTVERLYNISDFKPYFNQIYYS